MDMENQEPVVTAAVQPIGEAQCRYFLRVLEKYKAGRNGTENRILASENWWKLRNTTEEQKSTNIGKDGGFVAESGWLHNVIVSKHADAMEAYPEANMLPREKSDQEEAKKLSAIVPCVLEQNHFEDTYSDVMWQKLKTGTGVYKVVWDGSKLNGLGDIAVERANLLNLYWEPGVTDIQRGRYFFHTELEDKDLLEQQYPQLIGKLKRGTFVNAKFLYDDAIDTTNKQTVIDVYYHKFVNGRNTLQYCKFVGDQVLFATENEPDKYPEGWYSHGEYPYVFDALFPIEGSPCGYGYVDVCRNPQLVIDILNTAFVKNAASGALPRYWARQDAGVNEEEFLDTNNPIVHVTGNISEDALRKIDHATLDANYIAVLDRQIQELRETSGNTETSTGSVNSGVTAASAIAALQEASGKGSRDSTRTSYRAFAKVVDLCIENIRQFYDIPRQFRITGQYGQPEFTSYSNAGIQPQHQGMVAGQDMGYRKPVFDIKVTAQKKNVYTKVSQNELALQFFKMGFFNPQLADQATLCLEIMDFDGKDAIMEKIARNGLIMQKLMEYAQLLMTIAPELMPKISADMMAIMGQAPAGMGGNVQMAESDNISGIERKEHGIVANARSRANQASQPDGGSVTKEEAK